MFHFENNFKSTGFESYMKHQDRDVQTLSWVNWKWKELMDTQSESLLSQAKKNKSGFFENESVVLELFLVLLKLPLNRHPVISCSK